MTVLDATEARSGLHSLIDETAQTHRPIMIAGRSGNAILLAEEDWNAINETLYLVSIPGVCDSIREGMESDLGECERDLNWWRGSCISPGRRKRMQGSWPRTD